MDQLSLWVSEKWFLLVLFLWCWRSDDPWYAALFKGSTKRQFKPRVCTGVSVWIAFIYLLDSTRVRGCCQAFSYCSLLVHPFSQDGYCELLSIHQRPTSRIPTDCNLAFRFQLWDSLQTQFNNAIKQIDTSPQANAGPLCSALWNRLFPTWILLIFVFIKSKIFWILFSVSSTSLLSFYLLVQTHSCTWCGFLWGTCFRELFWLGQSAVFVLWWMQFGDQGCSLPCLYPESELLVGFSEPRQRGIQTSIL